MEPAGLDRLLRRARRRDSQALHELVDMYSARVFGLLYRLTGSRETAEDLLQETFLRVVRAIPEYRHGGKFEAWLFRIAANLARDCARRAARRGHPFTLDGSGREGELRLPELADAAQPDPGGELLRKETGQRLAELLHELPEMDREIVLLRHFSELSFREIAELLDIPLGTALARAHRALKRLRAALGEEV
ncbi:MAG: sigma-70 family RNA polymerase sigma factor [Planctomycetes bacterium]|nr:sigma-70 family RNA polymerase sigma factor [Planctomycetota bacterium]